MKIAFSAAIIAICCTCEAQSFTFSTGRQSLIISTAQHEEVDSGFTEVKPTPKPTPKPVETPVPVPKPVVVQQPAQQRQWYLVSESYCTACRPAKKAFKAKGWPDSNILTIAECQAKFGFSPPHIPFEFGDPTYQSSSVVTVQKPAVTTYRTMRDPSKRYAQWNGVTYDMETWSRMCSINNCPMCVYLDNAQAVYFSSAVPVVSAEPPNPQSSSPDSVVEEAIAVYLAAGIGKNDLLAELGCGDAKTAIRIANATGCQVVGYEYDPQKVLEARQNVRNAGLEHRITIHEADVVGLQLPQEVTAVYAYLYPKLLEKIRPQLMQARVTVLPGHYIDGIGLRASGQLWVRTNSLTSTAKG